MPSPPRPRHATAKTRKPRRAHHDADVDARRDAAPVRPLSATQRRYLRGLCHNLKPLVLLGNKGVTDQVTAELAHTLDDHELVKVKLSGGDRNERQQQLDALLSATAAELVQQIGHVASLYRRNREKPQLALPA